MLSSFADRLADAVRRQRTPALVGLDPRFESLPESLRKNIEENNFAAKAAAYRQFCCDVIDVVAPLVPAMKPQVAFFEELGPPGLAALADVIAHARKQSLLVVVDAKRNDIGSTATAYASAYFGSHAPWPADALTISPYLGGDSLDPFVVASQATGGGLFVLVKTSNPGGKQFQDLICEGRPLYRHVAAHVEHLSVAKSDRQVTAVLGRWSARPIQNSWPNCDRQCRTPGS